MENPVRSRGEDVIDKLDAAAAGQKQEARPATVERISQLRERRRESVKGEQAMRRITALLIVVGVAVLLPATASAESPARTRELECSDGTSFFAEQVRHGRGKPPSAWRIVGTDDAAEVFSVHSVTVTDTDGAVVESESWHHSQGVDRNRELVTCSFIIPVGPFTGYTASFEGFFAP
jgi:hypothetical protein